EGVTAPAVDDTHPITSERFLDDIERTSPAISPDGSALALGSWKLIQVFDAETGKERMKFEIGALGARHLAYSPDGKRLAVIGNPKQNPSRRPDGRTTYDI